MGFPISRANSSPFSERAQQVSTSWVASGMVMKYRMIRLSVTVSGPPAAICFLKSGTTEPLEASTFPNRVAQNFVSVCLAAADITIISHMRLVAPITFVGLTALSVDTIRNFCTLYCIASSMTFFVPKTLFSTASVTLCSISGTCLWAAACRTISG